ELSRAMLALRVVLAERGGRGRGPVLVFDEVDAGIGGEAGAAGGRGLAAPSRTAPGLCLTPPAPGPAGAGPPVVVRQARRDGPAGPGRPRTWWRARTGWRSCPACWRASRTPPTPVDTRRSCCEAAWAERSARAATKCGRRSAPT